MVGPHADQGIYLLHNISRLAGAPFAIAPQRASAGFRIITSPWALGLAVLVNLVSRRTLLGAFGTLILANAYQRPPLQSNITTLAHATSAQAFVTAVPVTPFEATRNAATYTSRVPLVGTRTFSTATWAVFGTYALQRFPSFHHVAGFADAALSGADLRASFRNWLTAGGWAE